MRNFALLLLAALSATAEIKTLTLRQAVELALAQNPDVLLARLDQQKVRQQVTITHDPFVPKVFAGTGAAWTSGFPASIDGSAPSIFQLRTQWTLFDRSQSYQVAAMRENVRGSEIETGHQQDDVIYRVASLFLDVQRAALSRQAAEREVTNLARALELVQARVADQRQLPLDAKKANLALQKARNAVETLVLDQINAEASLALALGMGPEDQVHTAAQDTSPFTLPESEEKSIEDAIENNRELKKLESSMQAKMLEIKGYKASRLPRVDAVAQYELLSKYYDQNYFTTFQRNNGQLGVSVSVPVVVGRSARAYMDVAEADIAKMKIQVANTRARIAFDIRRSYQEVKRAQTGRDFALADLDVTREQLNIELAQYGEGRLPMAEVEQTRALENEKWLVYYEAQHNWERARLNILRQSGTLQAALQ